MPRQRQLFWSAIVILALLLSACAEEAPTEPVADDPDPVTDEPDPAVDEPEGEPIVIGMIEDTAGGASAYSLVQNVGIELAIDEINAAGGILGRPVELIRENDSNEPSQTPTLTRRLIQNGAHVLLMNSGSASAIATKPVCAEAEIVCLAPGNVSPDIASGEDSEFSYIMAPPTGDMGLAYQDGMPAAGASTLAVISDDSPTIEGFNEFLLPIIEEGGVELLTNEVVPLDTSDVTAQVARIANLNPDAVMTSSLGGAVEILMHNTLFQQLPDVPRFTIASIGNQPDEWALAQPGALEGVVYLGVIDTANPRTQELTTKMEERLGDRFVALTGYHAQGYDSVYVLKAAIEGAGGTDDTAAINDGLQQISGYEPHYGQADYTLSFGPDKHSGSDGPCGIVLGVFGPDNLPAEPWDVFQTTC